MKKTINKYLISICLSLAGFVSFHSQALQTITISPNETDATPQVRAALENATDKDIKLVFKKARYKFLTTYASDKYLAITNHNNGFKKIIFNAQKFNSITIEGNGAEFIFRGLTLPFLFENCQNVTLRNFSIDWDIPFNFAAKVIAVNEKEGWRDMEPLKKGFSWKLSKGRILFPNIDRFSFSELGSSLSFDPITKDTDHNAGGMYSRPSFVEKLPNGLYRFHEKLRHYPPVGSIFNSKGPSYQTRYAPAVHVKHSSNIHIDGVVVHYSLGMGFLFEKATDVKLLNSGVYLKDGTNRVVSATADATHFANCKGDILIDNGRFENMLDDGTNVHGTYVSVDQVINSHTVRIALKHKQQTDFEFANVGDEMWFIHQPNNQRAEVNTVTNVSRINNKYIELTFDKPLTKQTAANDILENKTWNPTFTMRNTRIGNHRARNIVLKTPLKTVIENNHFFSSQMSAILFRGESFNWYESGAVNDVLIQNNTFSYVAHGRAEHAVVYITPRLGKQFDATQSYDRNIRFINNTVETFDNRIIWADRVDGLVVKGNTFIKTTAPKQPQLFPNAPLFELNHSHNIDISENSYQGEYADAVKADETSRSSLTMENNQGF